MTPVSTNVDHIKILVQQRIKELFSKPEHELKAYLAKGLMAVLTACVFVPLFASGLDSSAIAGIVGGIGGNLTAELISKFYNKYKKSELNLIDALNKKLLSSSEFKSQIKQILDKLEIHPVLHEISNKSELIWLKKEINYIQHYGDDIHQNLEGTTIKDSNVILVGKAEGDVKVTIGSKRQRFKKFIIIAPIFVLITITVLAIVINWPLPDMVEVSGGVFLSGPDRKKISLSTFWIDTIPVTNKQYKVFTDATGHSVPKHWNNNGTYTVVLDDHPVVNVSLYDAQDYAKWAKKRLPKIAEWEKACRGPNGNVYPWGDEWKSGISNTQEIGIGNTSPVDYYSLNKSFYGCLDLVGNVWEWTITSDSTYKNFYYIVGGAYNQSKSVARCYDARSIPAPMTLENLGFRCASDVAK